MASTQSRLIAREVHALYHFGTAAALTDEELLMRFSDRGDEVAFEALVIRHGPMVLRVCRDVLADPHEAQDAFQATFLVLLRRAGSIRRGASVGPWLHGVARRVAARTRARVARHRDRERQAPAARRPEAFEPDLAADLDRAALHTEIDRLPASYRAPIVLCYLEGLTHEQAAARLNWPVGTVRGRLARARDRLRDRLRRRGLTLAAGPWLPPHALPPSLVRVALATKAAPGMVPASVAALAEGALRAMFWHKTRMLALSVAAVGMLATGGLLIPQPGGAGEEGPPVPNDAPRTATPRSADPVNPIEISRPQSRPTREQTSPALEEILNRPISLPASDRRTLGEAIHSISEVNGLNIVSDPSFLADASVTLDTPIDPTAVHHVKLKNVLKRLLQPLQLTYVADGETLIITKIINLSTRVYHVADLVAQSPGSPLPEGHAPDRPGAARPDFSPLIDLLKDSVAPGSWLEDEVSATEKPTDRSKGSITPFYLNLSLIIRQTPEVHDQIVQRLRQLRRLRGLHEPEENREIRRDDDGIKRERLGNPTLGKPKPKPAQAAGDSADLYVIEPPDLLRVEVESPLPGHPINGERLVRPDGTITLGFYGDLFVNGLTVREAKEKLVAHLRQWLSDEQLGIGDGVAPSQTERVRVEVAGYNSKQYYVLGAVRSPGRFPLTGSETVIDAINAAGGIDDRKAMPTVEVVRDALLGPRLRQILPVDLAGIIRRHDPTTNYQLREHDRVLVYAPGEVADPDALLASENVPKRVRVEGIASPNSEPVASPAVDVSRRLDDQDRRLREMDRKLDRLIEALGGADDTPRE